MYSNLTGIYENGTANNVNPVEGFPNNKVLYVKNNTITSSKLIIDDSNNILHQGDLNIEGGILCKTSISSADISTLQLNSANIESTRNSILNNVQINDLNVNNNTFLAKLTVKDINCDSITNNTLIVNTIATINELNVVNSTTINELNVNTLNATDVKLNNVQVINDSQIYGNLNVGKTINFFEGVCNDLKIRSIINANIINVDGVINTPNLRATNETIGIEIMSKMLCGKVNGDDLNFTNLITDSISVKSLQKLLIKSNTSILGSLDCTTIQTSSITTDTLKVNGDLTLVKPLKTTGGLTNTGKIITDTLQVNTAFNTTGLINIGKLTTDYLQVNNVYE